MNKKHYLIKIQFLGFRYSGWQKQKNAKTVQGMIDRTISFIVGHEDHKTLGAGRTDAKVSANEYYFELFINDSLDVSLFLEELQENLPPDIHALDVKRVDKRFNIINDSKIKEYLYLFTTEQRPHPFSASLMVCFYEEMNIELMKIGAKLFEGKHDFKNYCYHPSEHTNVIRQIEKCEIKVNDIYTANFFPQKSWILHVHGKGFMRHQIRLMMGALVNLGRGDISLNELEDSFAMNCPENNEISFIVPSSGLILNHIHFNNI